VVQLYTHRSSPFDNEHTGRTRQSRVVLSVILSRQKTNFEVMTRTIAAARRDYDSSDREACREKASHHPGSDPVDKMAGRAREIVRDDVIAMSDDLGVSDL
jgi:hypothetical protein